MNNYCNPVIHDAKEDDKDSLPRALEKGFNLLMQLQSWRPVDAQIAEVEFDLFYKNRNTFLVMHKFDKLLISAE